MKPRFLEAVHDLVGAANFSTALPDRLANARGVWPVEMKWMQEGAYPHLPDAVVWPQTAVQVGSILRLAQQFGVPVIPFGGGSGVVGGVVAERLGISLDMKRMTGLQVDSISLVARAQAGWIGQDLETRLNTLGFTLGHYPQSMHSSTVGGWSATRAAGTFSTKYGKIDDMVVALEIALPTGAILRTNPAPRSSTGPDLEGLFLGCEGTLGVVTEAALRILPLPERRELIGYTFPGVHHGLEAVRMMLRSEVIPAVVRLYDQAESKSKLAALDLEGATLLILGFEGRSAIVEWELSEAERIVSELGGVSRGHLPGDLWFASRFDTRGMLKANQNPGGVSDAIEVAAPWANLESLYYSVKHAAEENGASVHAHFSHMYLTGGSVYVIFFADAGGRAVPAEELYQRILTAMLDACVAAGGTISHHHGVGIAKAAWMRAEHNAGLDVLLQVKKVLDPANILNPGKLGFPIAPNYGE